MVIDDYDAAIALWQQAEGIKLRDADSREGIERYLFRNPGMSFVVENENEIIAAIMSGHDGRRGYLQKLAVSQSYRKKGIGGKLVGLCISALKLEGIVKSHIHILSDNDLAKHFWYQQGWVERIDISVYSYANGIGDNT